MKVPATILRIPSVFRMSFHSSLETKEGTEPLNNSAIQCLFSFVLPLEKEDDIVHIKISTLNYNIMGSYNIVNSQLATGIRHSSVK
jgi:hypothetical protein